MKKCIECLRITGTITLAGYLAIAFSSDRTLAQIAPDGTLGAESSIVTPNANVGGSVGDRIDGGATRGANLFHSFLEFNVGNGQGVYFANPTGIQNIFSRVTGTNPSQIRGRLGVDGGANLFLLNPNGIIFGQNAQLDIAGSLVATTANSLLFENGFEFSTRNPQAPPLLTINLSPGLQYGSNRSGTISNRGNLAVGQNLTLAAGNLKLQGQLQAGGDLTLKATRVEGDAHYWTMGNFRIEKLDGSLGKLSSPNGSMIRANGDVTLAAYRGASLHIFAGGSVFIPGKVRITGPQTGTGGINFINETVTLSNGKPLKIDGSVHPTVDIRAGTTAFGSPLDNTATPTSSEIFIKAIKFDVIGGDGGRVFLTNQYHANPSLSGDISIRSIEAIDDFGGGSVTIDSRGNITVAREVNVSASSLSSFSDLVSGNYIYEGNGGDVTLLANGDINLTRGSGIVSEGLLGGNITLKSGAAIYATNSEVASASYTNQPGLTGGDIDVSATSLFFLRNATLRSSAYRQANGGSVTISATDSVSVTSGAQIGTEVLGQGKAGEVKITATNSVSLDGVGSNGSSGVVSQVLPRRIGNGNITINTGSLSITNGAAISTSTRGRGDAGSVKITANAVSLDGVSSNGESSRIQSEVYPQADGKGGTIKIETGSLSVTNGAVISASTAGQKDAGSIQINATEDVRISGDSRLETASFSSGKGGDIDIQKARSLFLMDGAQITSRSEGTGAAGNITIQTRQNLESDRSQITATTQSGDGGNINLTVGDLLLMRNNSQISTTAGNAQAGGNGGNITINTPFIVAVPIENSDITANAFTGTGGTVNITFAGIYGLEFRPRQTPKSDITASSEYGPQGTFEERNLTGIIAEQGLTNLPTEPVDRSRQITQNCRSGGPTAREKNQFIITGRGGIPASPNEPLQSEAVTTNWVTLNSDVDDKTTPPATTPHSSTPKQLVEAQGWIVDDNGQIVLTTQAPTVTPQGEWFSAADCNMPQAANTPQG